jgi:hypothetical protein
VIRTSHNHLAQRSILCAGISTMLLASSAAFSPVAAQTPPADTSWTFCVAEGSICNFSGTKTVRFGANGTYDYKTATGSIPCSDNGFTDPLPGVRKSCDIANTTTTTTTTTTSPTTTWTRCATEGAYCVFPGTKKVRYGANGTFVTKITGSIECSNRTFGDPIPGVRKACDYTDSTTTTEPTTSPTPAPSTSTMSPFGQAATAYTLSFSEEFNSGFNTARWNDHIWYETSNATKNYTVENGALKIWPQRDASGKFFNRTIDTDGKYYQTYGSAKAHGPHSGCSTISAVVAPRSISWKHTQAVVRTADGRIPNCTQQLMRQPSGKMRAIWPARRQCRHLTCQQPSTSMH